VNLEPIFDPRKRRPAPSPARVDMRIIFVCGTILFAVLAVGFGLYRLQTGPGSGYKFWICLFGFFIGLILLVWERFNRSTYMRLANDNETIQGLHPHEPQRQEQAQHTGTAKSTAGDTAQDAPAHDDPARHPAPSQPKRPEM
jgi:hypothetical protein